MRDYIKKEFILGKLKQERYLSVQELQPENLAYVDPLFFADTYGAQRFEKSFIYQQMVLVWNKILKRIFQEPLKKTLLDEDFWEIFLTKYFFWRQILRTGEVKKEADVLWHENGLIGLSELRLAKQSRILKLICQIYEDLKKDGEELRVSKKERTAQFDVFDLKQEKFSAPQYRTVDFLKTQINKKLATGVDYFLIHGSYATADFIPDWSDLDTFVILKKEIFADTALLVRTQKEIQKLSTLCYKINPLAHHTFFIFSDLILDNYAEHLLPLETLEYAISLRREKEIKIAQVTDPQDIFYNIWNYLSYFREKVVREKFSRDIFHYEIDLANILILPALMMQVSGEPMYKKFSFMAAKNKFSQFDWKLIEETTQKMKDWKIFNCLRFYPNWFFNLLPAKINNYFFNKYRFGLRRFKKIEKKEAAETARRALKLYEDFFSYCLENYKVK